MHLPEGDYSFHLRLGDPDELRLMQGDLTECPAGAIVNAANSDLLPGGGVCGAIHRKGGTEIGRECREWVTANGPVPAGQAVATKAGNLTPRNQYVIHAVGPIWRGGDQGEAEVLASCYREAMRVADELRLSSIAFPAISTGIYGYPIEQAAWVAIPTLIQHLRSAKHLVLVSMILFDKLTLDTFAAAALAQRQPDSGRPYQISIGILHA